ncbi:MAG: hypothetical protein EP330_01820 [Deltaproteobacteria bacterium]|nr:MAG: hypothetical protein EP330_01820 [Deltaproteobacteria bacterium]
MATARNRFHALAEHVLGMRWLYLALVAVLVVGAVSAISTMLRVDNSTEYFAASDAESKAFLDEFRAEFGRDEMTYVLAEGDVFTVEFLTQLRELHESLERFDLELLDAEEQEEATATFDGFGEDEGWGDEAGGSLVDKVTSLINFRRTVSDERGVRVVGFMDEPPTAEELPGLWETAKNDRTMLGNIVGHGGHHTVIAVKTRILSERDSDRVSVALREYIEPYEAEGFALSLTGAPPMNETLNRMVIEDVNLLITLATLFMIVMLYVLFRRPIAVIGPLVVVSCSSTFTMAAMALAGAPLTLLTNVLPAFICCVGLGDSIHVVSVWRDLRAQGLGNREAIVEAIGSTGTPIVLTSLTTAAGLASFYLSSSQATREVGVAGAFGVMAAMTLSLVLLPAILSFARGAVEASEPKERAPDLTDRFIAACTNLSRERGPRTALLATVLAGVIVLFWGLANLGVYHDPLVWFGKDSPVTIGIETMDAEVGGTAPASIVIDAKDAGVRDLRVLKAMEKLEAHILQYRQPGTGEAVVTNVSSVLDVLRETHQALKGGAEAEYRLPESQRGVDDTLLVFENAGPDELAEFVTGDYSRAKMVVRLKWMDASSYQPFAAHVDAGVDEFVGELAEVNSTGTIYNVLRVVDSLMTDLAKSFTGALLAITVMMIALFGRLKLGLIAMLPNLLPILFLLGFMGLTGIAIDFNNLLIASIALGIAVDDTIHYVHQFKIGFDRTGDAEDAIQRAIAHTGRALVSTTAVLVIGFGVYLSSRLISLQRFGLLIGLACIAALLSDLIVTPALLRVFYGRKSPSPGESHASA